MANQKGKKLLQLPVAVLRSYTLIINVRVALLISQPFMLILELVYGSHFMRASLP